MKLYVIRHGEVDFNRENRINGRNYTVLNENGINQAKKAGQIVKKLPIDLVICSPILRTRQTCGYVNTNRIQIKFDDRLMERDSRSMDSELVDLIDFNLWYDRSKDIIYEDTEGFKSIQSRIFSFIKDVKANFDNKNILVITHGDVCKAFYSYFNIIENDLDILKFDQDNCEIVEYVL